MILAMSAHFPIKPTPAQQRLWRPSKTVIPVIRICWYGYNVLTFTRADDILNSPTNLANGYVGDKPDFHSLYSWGKTAACTCPGESHPGPMRSDGSYVGRSAPEIDIFEAIVDNGVGQVRFLLQGVLSFAYISFVRSPCRRNGPLLM